MIDFFQTLHIKKFVFADAENANNPKAFIDFCSKNNYLNLDTQITCFIGANQNQNTWYTNAVKYIQTLKKQSSFNLTPIRILTQGENALDMVIASYTGLVMGQNNNAEFIIVSNDNDYASVIEHFSTLGNKIHREKIEQNVLKTKKNSSRKTNHKVDENKVPQLIQSILKIDKEKRPKTKMTLENVLKNNNRDVVKNKNSKDYADAVLKGLISQKKVSLQKNTLYWK
ncbi:MAG: hypothetical protein IJP90_09690 [Treponema sp.]|nr:hypothetical protein [Treponema sp.]